MQKISLRGSRAILLALAFSLIALNSPVLGVADARSQSAEIRRIAPQEVAASAKRLQNSSLIRTKQPGKVKSQAKTQGLRIISETKLPGKESILVVEGSIASPNIRLLQLKIPNIDMEILPNYAYKLAATPNDPKYSLDQWNLPKISAPSAWDITAGDSQVKIAVLDTGVLFEQSWGTAGPFTQPDFPDSKKWKNSGELGVTIVEGSAPNCTSRSLVLDKSCNNLDDDSNGYIDDWQGWDFMGGWRGTINNCPNFNDPDTYEEFPGSLYIEEDSEPQPYSCDGNTNNVLNKNHFDGDCNYIDGACFIGHGTSVASVAAAATNNGVLLAGLDWNAQIMNIRIVDGYGFSTTAHIIAGVEYATAMGADVINLSLALSDGFGNCDITDVGLEAAMAAAETAGVVIAAASGNDSASHVCYPASSSHAIAVGSSNISDVRSSFSNYGDKLDVLAPGSAVPAANSPSAYSSSNYYVGISGTSFAAPHVAGLAGLMKALLPDITLEEVREVLHQSADKLPAMGGAAFTLEHGYGRINAQKALQLTRLAHPDGTLIKAADSNATYWVEDGQRRHVLNPAVFRSQGFSSGRVRKTTIKDARFDSAPALDFREGSVVRGDSRTIYVIDYNGGTIRKRGITSLNTFFGLGYQEAEILRTSDGRLPVANGPHINSNTTTHPDGTLIKPSDGNAIYLIEAGKRRHVLSPAVFRSQGFSGKKIKTATSGDLNLAAGSPLNFREGAVVKGDGAAIYVIDYDGGTIRKRGIANLATFFGLGYTSSDIIKTTDSRLPAANGPTIRM